MIRHLYGSAVRLGLISLALPVALFAAPPARQPQLLYEWRGRVDKEIRVEMRGNRTMIDRIGDKETSNGRSSVAGALPRIDAPIRVETVEGRGRVDIVQQPTRQNGYTAIVRLRDTQSGASNYRIRVYTTADDNRGWNNGRGRGRDDGRYDNRNDDRRNDRPDGWGRY